MTEAPPTSTQLRADAQAETQRATELARRRSEIDQEIRDKQEQIKAERLRLARNGAAIETPVLTDELNALLAEREDLPEAHYVARENAATLMIRAESTKMQELAPEIEAARDAHDQAEEFKKAAEAEAKEKEATLGSLRQGRYVAKERRKHSEHELEKLTQEGVREMPAL